MNGVLFNGVDFVTPPTNLSIGYDSADNIGDDGVTGTSTGGVIDSLTTSFGRDAGVSMHSAMLTGLTVGQNYEVQFLASFANLNRTTTFDDGNGNNIILSTNNPHAFATGTFTADASTRPSISQPVPVPSSLAPINYVKSASLCSWICSLILPTAR